MKNPYELAENVLSFMPDNNTQIKVPDSFTSIDLYGESASKKEQDMDSCRYFELENESGTGTITIYQVFPGITITIDFAMITDEMRRVLELLSVDIERIKEISRIRDFTIIMASKTIEHIFSELYKVPEKIRYGYIRVKVLEMLLVLTGFDMMENKSEHIYFPEAQIDTVKQIHTFLKEHYKEHYTIEQLSEHFEMSPTVLKKCFKGVYGDSIYSYMKKYRLQIAERLLKENELSIGEIASQIGYLNPNKFTSAFCDEYGMPPTAYRKKNTQESLNG